MLVEACTMQSCRVWRVFVGRSWRDNQTRCQRHVRRRCLPQFVLGVNGRCGHRVSHVYDAPSSSKILTLVKPKKLRLWVYFLISQGMQQGTDGV